MEFLRGFFKNASITNRVFIGAYMTGILPIKKDGSQSAISEVREYTVLEPDQFAPYIGFTESEVINICDKWGIDYTEMKRWYDGYTLPGAGDIYNSNSVIRAATSGQFRSYWQNSSSADSLIGYLNMNFDGLGQDVDDLLKDKAVRFDYSGFLNDMSELHSRDDVLTLLTHFGYLAYDMESGFARVPNLEIKLEFYQISRKIKHDITIARIKESDRLLINTVHRNASADHRTKAR